MTQSTGGGVKSLVIPGLYLVLRKVDDGNAESKPPCDVRNQYTAGTLKSAQTNTIMKSAHSKQCSYYFHNSFLVLVLTLNALCGKNKRRLQQSVNFSGKKINPNRRLVIRRKDAHSRFKVSPLADKESPVFGAGFCAVGTRDGLISCILYKRHLQQIEFTYYR